MAEKLDQRMVYEAGVRGVELNIESVGTEIAGGADLQRNAPRGEKIHGAFIAHRANPVANALDAKNIESVLDCSGPPVSPAWARRWRP